MSMARALFIKGISGLIILVSVFSATLALHVWVKVGDVSLADLATGRQWIWNRFDGFSPGQLDTLLVGGCDIQDLWDGAEDRLAREGVGLVATDEQTPLNSHFLLEELLRTHRRRTIVLALHFLDFTQDPEFNLNFLLQNQESRGFHLSTALAIGRLPAINRVLTNFIRRHQPPSLDSENHDRAPRRQDGLEIPYRPGARARKRDIDRQFDFARRTVKLLRQQGITVIFQEIPIDRRMALLIDPTLSPDEAAYAEARLQELRQGAPLISVSGFLASRGIERHAPAAGDRYRFYVPQERLGEVRSFLLSEIRRLGESPATISY